MRARIAVARHLVPLPLVLALIACASTPAPPVHDAKSAQRAPAPVLLIVPEVLRNETATLPGHVTPIYANRVDASAARPDIAAKLEEARTLYRDLAFDKSLAATGEVQRRLEARIATDADVDALHLALTYRGMNELALDEAERAGRALRAAVALRPAEALSEGAFPPDVRALYEELRAAIRAEPPSTLNVRAAPSEAFVSLDGKEIGAAPLALTTVPGRHYLRVEAVGFASRTLPVELEAGETEWITLELPRTDRASAIAQLARLSPDESVRLSEASRTTLRHVLDVSTVLMARAASDHPDTPGAVIEVVRIDLVGGETERASGPRLEPLVRRLAEESQVLVGDAPPGRPGSSAPSGDDDDDDDGILESPWFWGAVGVVVIGALVTTATVVTYEPDPVLTVTP